MEVALHKEEGPGMAATESLPPVPAKPDTSKEMTMTEEDKQAVQGIDTPDQKLDQAVVSNHGSKQGEGTLSQNDVAAEAVPAAPVSEPVVEPITERVSEPGAEPVATLTTSTPAKPLRLRPSLRGTLLKDSAGQIVWEGKWGMDDSAFEGGVTGAFMYTRVHVVDDQASNNIPEGTVATGVGEGADADTLKNALFSGYFNMLIRGKSKRIPEKDVLFEFCTDDCLPDGSIKVVGSGVNQFGTYSLEGSLVLKTGELNVYREYKATGVVPPVRSSARPSTVKPKRTKQTPAKVSQPKALAPITPADSSGQTRNGRMRRTPSYLMADTLDDREAEDLYKLKSIVRDVMKNDREGWFAAPVNAEALGLRDYREIIKHPMDLGTVMKKFDHREYTSHESAIADVRLTFNNAITYNADGNGVNIAARRLLGIFESQLQKLSQFRANRKRKGSSSKGGRSKRPSHAAVFGESDDSDDNDSDDNSESGSVRKKKRKSSDAAVSSEVLMMKKQLERLKEQMKMMTDMQAAGIEMMQGQQFGVNHISAPPAKPAQQRSTERPLSYQEKRQLGQDINKLPGDMIEGVIRIIQESGAPLGQDGEDEVELDIEALDTPSLKKLQRYVKKALSKARAKKGLEDAVF